MVDEEEVYFLQWLSYNFCVAKSPKGKRCVTRVIAFNRVTHGDSPLAFSSRSAIVTLALQGEKGRQTGLIFISSNWLTIYQPTAIPGSLAWKNILCINLSFRCI